MAGVRPMGSQSQVSRQRSLITTLPENYLDTPTLNYTSPAITCSYKSPPSAWHYVYPSDSNAQLLATTSTGPLIVQNQGLGSKKYVGSPEKSEHRYAYTTNDSFSSPPHERPLDRSLPPKEQYSHSTSKGYVDTLNKENNAHTHRRHTDPLEVQSDAISQNDFFSHSLPLCCTGSSGHGNCDSQTEYGTDPPAEIYVNPLLLAQFPYDTDQRCITGTRQQLQPIYSEDTDLRPNTSTRSLLESRFANVMDHRPINNTSFQLPPVFLNDKDMRRTCDTDMRRPRHLHSYDTDMRRELPASILPDDLDITDIHVPTIKPSRGKHLDVDQHLMGNKGVSHIKISASPLMQGCANMPNIAVVRPLLTANPEYNESQSTISPPANISGNISGITNLEVKKDAIGHELSMELSRNVENHVTRIQTTNVGNARGIQNKSLADDLVRDDLPHVMELRAILDAVAKPSNATVPFTGNFSGILKPTNWLKRRDKPDSMDLIESMNKVLSKPPFTSNSLGMFLGPSGAVSEIIGLTDEDCWKGPNTASSSTSPFPKELTGIFCAPNSKPSPAKHIQGITTGAPDMFNKEPQMITVNGDSKSNAEMSKSASTKTEILTNDMPLIGMTDMSISEHPPDNVSSVLTESTIFSNKTVIVRNQLKESMVPSLSIDNNVQGMMYTPHTKVPMATDIEDMLIGSSDERGSSDKEGLIIDQDLTHTARTAIMEPSIAKPQPGETIGRFTAPLAENHFQGMLTGSLDEDSQPLIIDEDSGLNATMFTAPSREFQPAYMVTDSSECERKGRSNKASVVKPLADENSMAKPNDKTLREITYEPITKQSTAKDLLGMGSGSSEAMSKVTPPSPESSSQSKLLLRRELSGKPMKAKTLIEIIDRSLKKCPTYSDATPLVEQDSKDPLVELVPGEAQHSQPSVNTQKLMPTLNNVGTKCLQSSAIGVDIDLREKILPNTDHYSSQAFANWLYEMHATSSGGCNKDRESQQTASSDPNSDRASALLENGGFMAVDSNRNIRKDRGQEAFKIPNIKQEFSNWLLKMSAQTNGSTKDVGKALVKSKNVCPHVEKLLRSTDRKSEISPKQEKQTMHLDTSMDYNSTKGLRKHVMHTCIDKNCKSQMSCLDRMSKQSDLRSHHWLKNLDTKWDGTKDSTEEQPKPSDGYMMDWEKMQGRNREAKPKAPKKSDISITFEDEVQSLKGSQLPDSDATITISASSSDSLSSHFPSCSARSSSPSLPYPPSKAASFLETCPVPKDMHKNSMKPRTRSPTQVFTKTADLISPEKVCSEDNYQSGDGKSRKVSIGSICLEPVDIIIISDDECDNETVKPKMLIEEYCLDLDGSTRELHENENLCDFSPAKLKGDDGLASAESVREIKKLCKEDRSRIGRERYASSQLEQERNQDGALERSRKRKMASSKKAEIKQPRSSIDSYDYRCVRRRKSRKQGHNLKCSRNEVGHTLGSKSNRNIDENQRSKKRKKSCAGAKNGNNVDCTHTLKTQTKTRMTLQYYITKEKLWYDEKTGVHREASIHEWTALEKTSCEESSKEMARYVNRNEGHKRMDSITTSMQEEVKAAPGKPHCQVSTREASHKNPSKTQEVSQRKLLRQDLNESKSSMTETCAADRLLDPGVIVSMSYIVVKTRLNDFPRWKEASQLCRMEIGGIGPCKGVILLCKEDAVFEVILGYENSNDSNAAVNNGLDIKGDAPLFYSGREMLHHLGDFCFTDGQLVTCTASGSGWKITDQEKHILQAAWIARSVVEGQHKSTSLRPLNIISPIKKALNLFDPGVITSLSFILVKNPKNKRGSVPNASEIWSLLGGVNGPCKGVLVLSFHGTMAPEAALAYECSVDCDKAVTCQIRSQIYCEMPLYFNGPAMLHHLIEAASGDENLKSSWQSSSDREITYQERLILQETRQNTKFKDNQGKGMNVVLNGCSYVEIVRLYSVITASKIWAWFRGPDGPSTGVILVRNNDGEPQYAYIGFTQMGKSYIESFQNNGYTVISKLSVIKKLAQLDPSSEILMSTQSLKDEEMSHDVKTAICVSYIKAQTKS